MQSGSFSHAISWKARQILLFPFFSFLSFASQHTVQWKDERNAGTSKIHFQGGFYQCQTSVPCYWLHTTNFYFHACFGTWYQNSLLAKMADACFWYTAKGRRRLLVSLGYYVTIFLSNLWLMKFCTLSERLSRGGGRSRGDWFLISMVWKKVNVYLSFGTEKKSREGFKGTLHVSTHETTLLFSHSRR